MFLRLASILLLLMVTLLPSLASPYEPFVGDIYLAGTDRGVLLFRQKNQTIRKGDDLILRHIYTRPDGSRAVKEEVVYTKGKFSTYILEFDDSDCGCQLNRAGDEIVFSFTRGDKDKTGKAQYYSNLVMGPTLNRFVHRNWSSLVSGTRRYFFLPAMTIQRIAKFQIYKNDESPYLRDGAVVFKMEVTNRIYRLFLKPVDMVYDLETKRLIEIHGQSLLRRRVNGKVENPIVDIYYRYTN